MVEIVGAILACGAAFLTGYNAAPHWAWDTGWSVIIGAAAGEFCAFAYFGVLLTIGMLWPGSLDAHGLGVDFLVLMAVAPLFGAPAGWFGYRKSLGLRLF